MSCRTEHLGRAVSENAAAHCPHAMEAATGPCADEILDFDCALYESTCVTPGITAAYTNCAAMVAAQPGVRPFPSHHHSITCTNVYFCEEGAAPPCRSKRSRGYACAGRCLA